MEQLAAMRRGELSPVELTEHYLDRIQAFDAVLGAYVVVCEDVARAEAKTAERIYLNDPSDSWPALLGLPVPIKDLHATAGVATSQGTHVLRADVPEADGHTVGLLRRAGTVLLGKTTASEFGVMCFSVNPTTGSEAVTPYDTARYSSGSSGGAASAVAAGLAPVAHASDGAGSTRSPASATGLVGYKPSRGVCSPQPWLSWAATACDGTVARTVTDAALLADVMNEPAPGDLWPDPRPRDQRSMVAALTAGTRRLRVGFWTATGVAGVTPDPSAAAAVQELAAHLAEQGHHVEPAEVPWTHDEAFRRALWMRFCGRVRVAADALPETGEPRRHVPFIEHLLSASRELSMSDSLVADAALAQHASAVLRNTSDYDVLLCPTVSGPAPNLGWFEANGVERVFDRMLDWSCATPFANLTGQCAMSLPLAWTSDGLPVGVQLTMQVGHDAELFALAASVERQLPWAHHQAPHMSREAEAR